ncbi:hypothetical protein [Neobacillus mesonae]|uniref:hypothetical protein n=1 Tax=Neobacillus mesonae TaxID=1193713 RepID=UPI00203E79A9|nr:hypothetical protein [Neobacillus mesonae]MCM3569597.1 hypothetical protein [Neobacillus mesonae]
MTWRQYIKDKSTKGNLYHFIEYKKNKPFFQQPLKITVDDDITHTYYMVRNIVYRDKQILAMKKDDDPNTIILVEAVIEGGQLKYITMLPDPILKDVSVLFDDMNE